MALIKNCLCCSVAIASGFFAAYLLIAYLIAFAFELLWIIESEAALPNAAILLCAGYFTMALFAAMLIHGLATKTTVCLLGWMLSVMLLTFPEAGLVIYMSIQYWRIESMLGVTELSCWLIRIVVNLVEIILIHSLHSAWKHEQLVHKRLRDLNLMNVAVPAENAPPLNSQYYHNNGYEHSMEHIEGYNSMPDIWNAIPMFSYGMYSTSEFNASIFVPNNSIGKRAQSMMDLRLLEEHAIFGEKPAGEVPAAPKLSKCASLDALNGENRVIRNCTGFYARPIEDYGVPIYYGPLDGPDFLVYKKRLDKSSSRNSLSNTTNTSADDVHKYRDIAL
ncbi:unnamed protein product [Phyllotreta striolata]|uniref:Uncharacterized protein n=1 Tax=Phyllotreta striolata TaxID=444603 RepID=A0A9N9XPG8_PHYSR|nr:unnamed protein product [Phyllotreta striolata]